MTRLFTIFAVLMLGANAHAEPTGKAVEFSWKDWSPTATYKQIDSAKIGKTLDDAVRTFGQWDLVGDVMSDDKGQFYPFSNRNGFDYLVRIASDSSINGVWRRKSTVPLPVKNRKAETHKPAPQTEPKPKAGDS